MEQFDLPADEEWSPRTREWWAAIWLSPVHRPWQEGDAPDLLQLARLDSELERATDAKRSSTELVRLMRAIRELDDRFGLNPAARQKMIALRVEPDQAEGNISER